MLIIINNTVTTNPRGLSGLINLLIHRIEYLPLRATRRVSRNFPKRHAKKNLMEANRAIPIGM